MQSKAKTNIKFNCCFLTLNCKGQGDYVKRKTQYTYARDMMADFVFFQETHSQKDTENSWRNMWGNNQVWFSHGETNARGVAIHASNRVQIKVINVTSDTEGRFICLDCELYGQKLMLVNIYAPNTVTEQKIFYSKLREHLQKEVKNEHNIVIGGDCNLIMNPTKDKQGGRPDKHQGPREILNDILEDHNLIDSWRAKNRFKQAYTFELPGTTIKTRLDMWFTPVEWLQMTKKCNIVPGIRTDHKAVEMTIQGNQLVETEYNSGTRRKLQRIDPRDYQKRLR